MAASPVDFEPLDDTPFLASFNAPLNQAAVFECQFSAGTVVNCPEAMKGGNDMFSLWIANSSGVYCEHLGHGRHRIDRGEAALTRDDAQMRAGSPAGFKGITVEIPRAEFEDRGIRPDDIVMQRLSRRNEALVLLRAYLQVLGKSGVDSAVEFGAATAAREIVLRHIFDFVALAFSRQGAIGESNLGSVADARLRTALGYIETHFEDPRLTIEIVAHSQGISATYLRRLMKASGRSYVEVVNELRLQKALTELSAASPENRTILGVAMGAGFSDISNFNRLFRVRFGDTPTGVRKKRDLSR